MRKITVVPSEDRVYVENNEGEIISMETYEFVIDLEKVVDHLRLDIEVEEVDERA